IVITQDDVNALALLDERSGRLEPLLLPRGADGRRSFGEATGNKALKLDLEACVTVPDGRLIAFGSGSKPARERIVVVEADRRVTVVEAQALYSMLASASEFAGSELNLEGAIVVDDALRLFQRGNGAPRGELLPVDAIGDLSLEKFLAWLDGGPLPRLERVRRFELGRIDGVRLGFCDAALLPDGRVAFVAGAEDSPDTYRDGIVVGCRFGIIDGDDVRTADVIDAEGTPSRLKLEGLELRSFTADAWEFDVVVDMDDPDTPTRIGILRVTAVAEPQPNRDPLAAS
ncbi:MAG TPA: hypothetical protein VK034_22855, partial [Enhygromyxa sp.]|nr:hypothetical protein [Enhygromyxa sp.]